MINFLLFCYLCSFVQQVVAVDTNGAGDTFATAYMLALASGSVNPGREAAVAAGCAVTKPQVKFLDCSPEL